MITEDLIETIIELIHSPDKDCIKMAQGLMEVTFEEDNETVVEKLNKYWEKETSEEDIQKMETILENKDLTSTEKSQKAWIALCLLHTEATLRLEGRTFNDIEQNPV